MKCTEQLGGLVMQTVAVNVINSWGPCCQMLAFMRLTVGDRSDPCCQILALMGITVGDRISLLEKRI